jgi:hypothetical protein
MRDINRAERLLSLFTSPDSAAGIVGDLSEERGQRGGVWFWRQVLGTVLSLVRGALVESPGIVLLLVLLGIVLSVVVVSLGTAVAVRTMGPSNGLWIFLFLVSSAGALIAGATLVAAAPRVGMAACVLVAGIHTLMFLVVGLYLFSVAPHIAWVGWVSFVVSRLSSLVLLCLGGAMIKRRWNGRTLRTAE